MSVWGEDLSVLTLVLLVPGGVSGFAGLPIVGAVGKGIWFFFVYVLWFQSQPDVCVELGYL